MNTYNTTGFSKRRYNGRSHSYARPKDQNSEVLVFDNDFVAPLVMQYLDIPSLMAFASTCRYHYYDLLDEEVKRRKDLFQQIKLEIQSLLSPTRAIPPCRVKKALLLQTDAKILIDGGLGWLESKKHVQSLTDSAHCCSICRRDRFFL